MHHIFSNDFRIRVVVLWLFFLLASCGNKADITVNKPWVQRPPSSALTAAGYLTIINNSRQSITLTGASSADFKRIEIHQTTHSVNESGFSSAAMQQLQTLVIEPNQSAQFSPGGLHLMLIAPQNPLATAKTTSVSLEFEHADGEQSIQILTFPILQNAP